MPKGYRTTTPGPDGTLRGRHRSGRAWERFKVAVYARYGRTCHICGHGGAGEVGHLEAYANNPTAPLDIRKVRPMHGSNAPCPKCLGKNGKPRCCNQEQGTKSFDEIHRPRTPW